MRDRGDSSAVAEVEVGSADDGLRVRLMGGPWCRVDLTHDRAGRDPIVKAVRPPRIGGDWHVVDATGGWGIDAVSIARSGARVTLVERDPLIASLLEDAWTRASKDPAQASVVGRITLVEGDAVELLPSLEPPAEVVYLDPMYDTLPGGAKRARLEFLRTWLQARNDDDAKRHGAGRDGAEVTSLLAIARRVATRRVVVKRGMKAAPLAGRSGSIEGRTTRFDLFAPIPASPLDGRAPAMQAE